jgi:hypothetical protein
MKQAVIEQMPSPLQRGQSVLTLACGHLWSWNSPEPPPVEIDCTHCDGPESWTLSLPGVREMDLAVRNLRRSRHGLPPLQPESKLIQ